MQILDHHDHRREAATRLQQLLKKLARAQADQHTVEPRQRAVRDFEAEQVEQQAKVANGLQAECRQPISSLSATSFPPRRP